MYTEAFEGLGLGTRLAFLQLPAKWDWVPSTGALVYSAMTPLGMAIGLGAQGGLVGSSPLFIFLFSLFSNAYSAGSELTHCPPRSQ